MLFGMQVHYTYMKDILSFWNSIMTFNEYKREAIRTAIYPHNYKIIYPALGMCGECGEVVEKIKKVIRDNQGIFDTDKTKEIEKELGDVLWYIANICNDLNIDFDNVAQNNINKINARLQNNTLHGKGDNR